MKRERDTLKTAVCEGGVEEEGGGWGRMVGEGRGPVVGGGGAVCVSAVRVGGWAGTHWKQLSVTVVGGDGGDRGGA